MTTSTTAPPAVYPIPAPTDDARFTIGLLVDVADVLAKHGFPTVAAGADIVELQLALFGFLYGDREV